MTKKQMMKKTLALNGIWMYKDDPNVVSQIANKKAEEQKPYLLVNSCLNDVNTFINNSDYVVNSSYIDEGIKSFEPIDKTNENND